MTATLKQWEDRSLLAMAFVIAWKVVQLSRRDPMYPTSTQPQLYECISCESTNFCRFPQLKQDGWDTHKLPDGGIVVLCDGCKETFAERRRIREALSWS